MRRKKVGVGLYGNTGHQIHDALAHHPEAELVAIFDFPEAELPISLCASPHIKRHESLDAMLEDPRVELLSICAPRKDHQGDLIIQALQAGKHVYAEKPCCLSEEMLDRIIQTAQETGKRFHEMTATTLASPYGEIREIVASGILGEVVQVLSQKSYPWNKERPHDEREDGGLALQVGIYNARFAEHVAGLKIASLEMRETTLGNGQDEGEGCRRAVSMLMEFENGAVGSAIANYCCPAPPSWSRWGYENLRIFGTKGWVESIDQGRTGHLALEGQPLQELDFSAPGRDWLEMFLEEIQSGESVIPFSLEEELSPTRWVLRAKAAQRTVPKTTLRKKPEFEMTTATS